MEQSNPDAGFNGHTDGEFVVEVYIAPAEHGCPRYWRTGLISLAYVTTATGLELLDHFTDLL